MRLLVLLPLLLLCAIPARAESRAALVVGNGTYRSVPALPNPANDARAVADRLGRLGFDVTLVLDGDKRAMDAALRAFGRRVPKADIALVFYAGHGVQVDGRNYLVPVDAKLPQQTQDLRYDFVDVAAVMDELASARRLRVVVLDACRDNPIAAQLSRSVGRSLGGSRGLAVPADVDDTLVAYATAADSTAADGDGAHSPFSQALLDHIDDPGLDIRLMFGRVRDEVRRATSNRQNPFVYVSLGGDSVTLNPGPSTASPPPPPAAPSAVAGIERPVSPPPAPLAGLLAGRWRHADGQSCANGLFGTVTLADGMIRFDWRLPGGGRNVAVERVLEADGDTLSTLVLSDTGTPRPEVGHRNRYVFEPGRWRSESLTTGERSVHLRC